LTGIVWILPIKNVGQAFYYACMYVNVPLPRLCVVLLGVSRFPATATADQFKNESRFAKSRIELAKEDWRAFSESTGRRGGLFSISGVTTRWLSGLGHYTKLKIGPVEVLHRRERFVNGQQ
jgi:hypothetical protein